MDSSDAQLFNSLLAFAEPLPLGEPQQQQRCSDGTAFSSEVFTTGLSPTPRTSTSTLEVAVFPSSSNVKSSSSSTSSSKRKRTKRSKKPKDMPRRPLSAYNLFFKDERRRILKEIPTPDGYHHGVDSSSDEEEGPTSSGCKSVLPSSTRIPHGKIGFRSLAKTIAKRWKELPSAAVDKYQMLASEETERYKREMDEYNTRKVRKKIREMCRQPVPGLSGIPTTLKNFKSGIPTTFNFSSCLSAAFAGGRGTTSSDNRTKSQVPDRTAYNVYLASVARASSMQRTDK